MYSDFVPSLSLCALACVCVCMLVRGGNALLNSWQYDLCDNENKVVWFLIVTLGSWEDSNGQHRNIVCVSEFIVYWLKYPFCKIAVWFLSLAKSAVYIENCRWQQTEGYWFLETSCRPDNIRVLVGVIYRYIQITGNSQKCQCTVNCGEFSFKYPKLE